MDPQNPLFYVGTFITNNAAGLLEPSQMTMDTLVGTMADACSIDHFQPDRCAVLSQMVGRIRTQDAYTGYGAPLPPKPVLYTASPLASNTSLAAATVTPLATPAVTPATITSALATIGTLPGPSTMLARCS